MTEKSVSYFPPPPDDATALETGPVLCPRFDHNGLIPAIATDHKTGKALMMAYMNAEALKLTLETGIAHYFSRSRQSLWKKGETSGQIQDVVELRVDCDQDCIWLEVHQHGDGCCHVGHESCFYRRAIPAADGGFELVTTPHITKT
ncbi:MULTISPECIES: phosphoribosyl-AMP cyclohydrolase [unclassified Iodidimonas]|jgi:phosphoribosyl-AMP cyclohydrolase|uniref:phosphoribosyl-AMP cyclohydrolase n=1 Tax=unclassified Iodidimonas TaxID=2626145 RepID=UPI002482349D|nr:MULTISPECIES: phosphoribosyl-AMP cyclohydrolase [unclassified Iodidimonas]